MQCNVMQCNAMHKKHVLVCSTGDCVSYEEFEYVMLFLPTKTKPNTNEMRCFVYMTRYFAHILK